MLICFAESLVDIDLEDHDLQSASNLKREAMISSNYEANTF